MSLRIWRIKLLYRALLCLYLLVGVVRVLSNSLFPKSLSRKIACLLPHIPFAWEEIKDMISDDLADSSSPIFSEDKKFSDSVGGHFIKSTDKYESCYFAIYTYKERMAFWFSPVMIKIGIAKKPMLVYILWCKLTVVVLA